MSTQVPRLRVKSGVNMGRPGKRSQETLIKIGAAIKATHYDSRTKCPRCEILITGKIYLVGNRCNLCVGDGVIK